MKKLQISTTFFLTLIFTYSFGQLKVDTYGRIGIGTNAPRAGFACHIKGMLLISDYPTFPSSEFYIKVGNGTEIGSNRDLIQFWAGGVGYHQLNAETFYKTSDSTLKFDVTNIANPLEKIMNVKAHKFNYKNVYISDLGDTTTELIPQYGFISQEVQRSLKEVNIVEEGKEGIKLMDYDQIIPLLTAAMQEQQKIIQQLQSTTAILMATNPNYSSDQINGLPEMSRLIGCTPNPFTARTVIECKLIQNYNNAEIRVTDMQGVMLKSKILDPTLGTKTVTLSADELPMVGRYVYSLFVNGAIIDAKTVILN